MRELYAIVKILPFVLLLWKFYIRFIEGGSFEFEHVHSVSPFLPCGPSTVRSVALSFGRFGALFGSIHRYFASWQQLLKQLASTADGLSSFDDGGWVNTDVNDL